MMRVRIGVFIVLGNVLELFVAKFAVERPQRGRYLAFEGSLASNSILCMRVEYLSGSE